MEFLAQINIMPQKALLDPQGKAVLNSAKKIGFDTVNNIRVGKHIEIEVQAKSEQNAAVIIDDLCKKILINPIVKSYEFKLFKI